MLIKNKRSAVCINQVNVLLKAGTHYPLEKKALSAMLFWSTGRSSGWCEQAPVETARTAVEYFNFSTLLIRAYYVG